MSTLSKRSLKVTPKGLNRKDLHVSITSILWFLFGVQLLMANILKHSVFYQASAILFIVASFFVLFMYKALRLNKYYIISMFFILYNLFFIILGNVISASHSLGMLRTISINIVLFVLTYSFFVYANDTKKLLVLYVRISAISSFVILYVFKDSLFTGRLAFSWGDSVSSFNIFGIEVVTAGSNGIAYFCAIAFLLSTYLFYTQKNKSIYVLYNLLFLFTVLSTGSRKGLFILVIGFIYLIWLLNKKSKKVIYGTIAICLVPLIYYITQSVPIVYEVMGSRIEELLNLILGKEVNDSSINTRLILLEMGFAAFKESPLYGHGLDAFRIIGPWGIVTDNNYLEILVSSGIIGLLIYYSYTLIVLRDYCLLKKRSNICKLFFFVFVLGLFLDYGSVTYFERSFGFVNAMLFYILQKEKKEEG